MVRTVMRLSLVATAGGSRWESAGAAPDGMLRRMFAKLRRDRHGPDGPAIVAPFG